MNTCLFLLGVMIGGVIGVILITALQLSSHISRDEDEDGDTLAK